MAAELNLDESQHIDLLLATCERVWSSLPELEKATSRGAPLDDIQFLTEWPLEEDALEQLEEYGSGGAMTEGQHRRWSALRQLVERHRSTAERLLDYRYRAHSRTPANVSGIA